jgi:nitrite reductase (NO-forming)
MWDTAAEALRRWSILTIGLVLIVGGFWLGQVLYSADRAKSPNQTASAKKSPIDTSHQMAPNTLPGQSAPGTPHRGPSSPSAASEPTQTASQEKTATSETKEAKQAQAARDHMAQMAPASAPTTSGQAAPASKSPTAAAAAPAPGGGDAAAGRLVLRKCQACHSLDAGKNMLGPSLAGVVGRKSGSEPGYNYSPAMRQSNLTWDPPTLERYLDDPAKVVPGNKMPFPGLKTDHDRADVIAYLASATSGQGAAATPSVQTQPATAASPTGAPAPSRPQSATGTDIGYIADAKYTLRSGIAEGRMVYIGVGGAIEGKVNPVLTASEGQVVQLTLINGEGAEHDIVFPDQDTKSPRVTGKGASTTIAFRASKSGDFTYYCSVPGHGLAGMEGQFIVTPKPSPQTVVEADISREPGDLPPPVGDRDPQTVRVDLLSVEVEGRLAEGTTFGY